VYFQAAEMHVQAVGVAGGIAFLMVEVILLLNKKRRVEKAPTRPTKKLYTISWIIKKCMCRLWTC